MSRIADEHLKALAGAQQPINAPWAAGTPTRRDLEFQESMDWDREKHAAQLAAATAGSSPYGSGAEGFAAMRDGLIHQEQDPFLAGRDPEKVAIYQFVQESIAKGDNWDRILETLNVERVAQGWTKAQAENILEWAELAFEREIDKKTPGAVVPGVAPGGGREKLMDYLTRLGETAESSAGTWADSKRQGISFADYMSDPERGFGTSPNVDQVGDRLTFDPSASSLVPPNILANLAKKK